MVGSQAYGLATPESDTDYLGVFAHPTFDLVGLHPPKLTVEQHKPDLVLHEAGKYAKLALGCNPTVLDLLWLPEYEVVTPLGQELVEIRTHFLSATRVKNAYLGYATQQFKRIAQRGDNSFSSDTRKRTAKHARHLMRLCQQGYELWSQGTMTLRVRNPGELRTFGERLADGHLEDASKLLAEYAHMFKSYPSVLPKKPDERTVEHWLYNVRALLC